jgi:hypothetical protein
MVIIKTNAVEVSIQAVSPELILSVPIRVGSVGAAEAAAAASVGAAAGAAESLAAEAAAVAAEAGVSSAQEGLTENNNSPKAANWNILVINANPLTLLDCICAPLIRANAHDLVEIEHEDLAVADFAGFGRCDDCLDHLVRQGILDGNFDLGFWNELNGIFGAPIDLGVTALAPEAANLAHGDAFDPDVANCLSNVVELEWLYDCSY